MVEVVRVIELDEIESSDEEERFEFRFEILKDLESAVFYVRLCRWHLRRLIVGPHKVSALQEADEEITAIDSFWDWAAHPAPSPREAMRVLLDALKLRLPEATQLDALQALVQRW